MDILLFLIIRGDKDVMEMVHKVVGKDGLVHLYLVQGNETSPTTLRSQSPTAQPLSSISGVSASQQTLSQNLNNQPANTIPDLREAEIEEELEEADGDEASDDEEVVGSESSDSDKDFEFIESEGEDDDLFVQNVDDGVGLFTSGGAINETSDGEAPYVDNEMPLDESEDLRSVSGSDGDTCVRYPQFNPLVDFKKKINLKSGLIFGSNEIFRQALRQWSIENGGDYYYLHNDKTRISVYCKSNCFLIEGSSSLCLISTSPFFIFQFNPSSSVGALSS